MFGIGGSEILIIAFVALLLFGPDKLPQMARTIGRFMREFKRYQAMMESTFRAEMYLAETEEMKAEAKADPYKKAREYREQAGVVAPGETPPEAAEPVEPAEAAEPAEPAEPPEPVEPPEPTEPDAEDDDEDAPIAPEDAGWVPGTPGAPGMPVDDDGEEEGEQL